METTFKKRLLGSALAIFATVAPITAHAQTKISQMTDGGTIQATDELPVVRGGSNFRVVVGSAATQAIAAFLQPSNNLSDLVNVATARANLGLGSAALLATSGVLQPSNNLSDVSSTIAALTNILPSQTGHAGQFLTTNGTASSWASALWSGNRNDHGQPSFGQSGVLLWGYRDNQRQPEWGCDDQWHRGRHGGQDSGRERWNADWFGQCGDVEFSEHWSHLPWVLLPPSRSRMQRVFPPRVSPRCKATGPRFSSRPGPRQRMIA